MLLFTQTMHNIINLMCHTLMAMVTKR